jgi:hypothetical protein
VPYPPSTVITGIAWAPVSSIVRQALDSDNWPITWADDDSLYTAYGDGKGFVPKVPTKLSLGFAKVQGPATSFTGTNVRSSTGEQTGNGAAGKKASGMLMVNGVLYTIGRMPKSILILPLFSPINCSSPSFREVLKW